MTKLKDLIAIPERVHQGDFVLSLSEGLTRPSETVRDYVTTPELALCFDQALGMIRAALTETASKAAYLHGSFGAGKSHFMAVLNLVLAGNVAARSLPELAPVVAKHAAWMADRRFLMVPYHMVAARDVESAVLGQYADHIRRVHPDKPPPGVYLATALFADAERMRRDRGDDVFFSQLNEGKSRDSNGGWGDLDAGLWDTESFETAMLQPPTGAERQSLVGDLVARFFQSYGAVASAAGEAYLSLDDGLAVMSQHAKGLGYDGVILFLDEMILWLASRAADAAFVSREGAKLVKLVEATRSDRPVPLVSFIARQRDLRELVGETLAGAVAVQVDDVLKHNEGRFGVIKIEDRNLPVIANKRILKPVSESARQTLEAAFEETRRLRPQILATLLTTQGEERMFRLVYPFSPALVQTLIAISTVLQRERTALKLMLQLLVDRRNELELGQIIPVGDLWDVIEDNNEPFSDAMRFHFENARKLWRQRLLPLLEQQHDITWSEARRDVPAPGSAAANLRNDARLAKTLLFAALVPEVEAMRSLTAARLAALNHGSVKSPIPGLEAQTVLTKLRSWAAAGIGEIKIGEDANPTIAVQITSVDTEPIIAEARGFDNQGNRRRKVRETMFGQIGVAGDQLLTEYAFDWRGTRRSVNIVLDNIRDSTDERLHGQAGTWTVALGYPFDDPPFNASDHLARVRDFDARAETIVWLPSFFSAEASRDLGTLVALDQVLTGDRLDGAARHLNVVERAQARALLENQRSALEQRFRASLAVAYGIADQPADAVAGGLQPEDHLISLDGAFDPRLPVGASLKDALDRMLDALFAFRFPAHPRFDVEARPAILRKVCPVLQQAAGVADGRIPVDDKSLRPLIRAIANPLQLGTMGETHLLLDPQWRQHFDRQRAGLALEAPVTVGMLRGWTDEPQRRGLTREVQNLVILVYADQANLSFLLNGVIVRPTLDDLRDELVLREEQLPPESDWVVAVDRAGSVFGLTAAEVRNAANVARLAEDLRGAAGAWKPAVESFCRELSRHLDAFGPGSEPDRLRTAREARALLTAIETAENPRDVIAAVARANVENSETAIGQVIAHASDLDATLRSASWPVLEAMRNLADEREPAAREILRRLGEALAADEHAVPLSSTLAELGSKAVALLTETRPPPPSPKPPEPDPAQGVSIIDQGRERDLTVTDAEAALQRLAGRVAEDPRLRLRVDLNWRLIRDGV
jgi:hypothetical protein